MAEGFKSNPAVVAAHAALTDTAEWHIARCKMNDRVIDTAAAKSLPRRDAKYSCMVEPMARSSLFVSSITKILYPIEEKISIERRAFPWARL